LFADEIIDSQVCDKKHLVSFTFDFMEAVVFEGCSLSTCFGDFLGTDGILSVLTNSGVHIKIK